MTNFSFLGNTFSPLAKSLPTVKEKGSKGFSGVLYSYKGLLRDTAMWEPFSVDSFFSFSRTLGVYHGCSLFWFLSTIILKYLRAFVHEVGTCKVLTQNDSEKE